jgi:uncharacterized membrane protein
MEELLRQAARLVAELIEAIAVLLIAYGAGEAFVNSLRHIFRHLAAPGPAICLAADIERSAIAPTWNDIGQLAPSPPFAPSSIIS